VLCRGGAAAESAFCRRRAVIKSTCVWIFFRVTPSHLFQIFAQSENFSHFVELELRGGMDSAPWGAVMSGVGKMVRLLQVALLVLLPMQVCGDGCDIFRRKVMYSAAKRQRSGRAESADSVGDAKSPRGNGITLFGGDSEVRRKAKKGLLKEIADGWGATPGMDFQSLDYNFFVDGEIIDGGGIAEVPADGNFDEDALSNKLNNIMVPRAMFVGVPLSDVITSLTKISEENDPSEDEGKRGVNIVLLDLQSAGQCPTVTINLKNVSLYRLIEFVARSAAYQFDVTSDAVIFYKRDMAMDVVETRFFPVSRATLIRLIGQHGVDSCGNKNSNAREDTVDCERMIMEFFQRAGVDFKATPGSTIAFDGSQIIVTNTNRNLRKIGAILQKYSTVRQVEIETKFLEVQQGVLDELGFRWQFANAKHPNDTYFHTGDKSLDNLRTAAQAFGMANFSRGDGIIKSGDVNLASELISNRAPGLPGQMNFGADSTPASYFTGILNRMQFNVMVRALEQHSGSDLMSAPKLTVLSGKTAKIVIAMELRYPQKYGDTHSAVGTGSATIGTSSAAGVTITSGTPQDFAMRNVGVEMSVTPTVESDGSISLQLEPKVTEFEGFVEYGGMNVAISAGTTVTIPSGFFQPIFSTREIYTEINIADGATVVMGGLTREEVKEVNDKVPILGDLPLIGCLFRSRSETTQKRNLLIFVTARTIPSSGRN
jgi:general secretion pathway protein D